MARGALRIAIEDFLETSPLGKWIRGLFTSVIEDTEASIAAEFPDMLDELNKYPGLKGIFDRSKLSSKTGEHQGGVFSAVGMAAGAGSGAASSFLAPIFRLINYKADRVYRSSRIDPNLAIQAFFRDKDAKELLENDIADLGWDSARIEVLTKLFRPRLSQTELTMLVLREALPEAAFKEEMKARGFLESDIEGMIRLFSVIPPIQDIIRMAVRDAWNEDTVRRFNYDADLPGEVIEWAGKQGLSPEWVKNYWRAHWEIPSPTQAYTMLHRLRPGRSKVPFTKEDLSALLRTADYPVFFRQRLEEISFKTHTRVDIRRLFQFGILDEDEVYQEYLDDGYTEQRAKDLTAYTVDSVNDTVESKTGKRKQLTLSALLNLYKKTLIDEATLTAKLTELKYTDEDIQYEISLANLEMSGEKAVNYEHEYNRDLKNLVEAEYSARFIDNGTARELLSSIGMNEVDITNALAIADYKSNANKVDSILSTLKEGYINGSYSFQDVVQEMGKIGVSGSSQTLFFEEWDTLKGLQVRTLTEAQYRKAWMNKIIDEAQYRDYLKNLGYSKDSINILVSMYSEDEETE